MELKSFMDDLARTNERKRRFTINDHEYQVQCMDPYGFWRFVGKLIPEEIDGSYSTYEKAVRAAESYEAKRTRSGQINPDKRVSSKVKKTQEARKALDNGA